MVLPFLKAGGTERQASNIVNYLNNHSFINTFHIKFFVIQWIRSLSYYDSFAVALYVVLNPSMCFSTIYSMV